MTRARVGLAAAGVAALVVLALLTRLARVPDDEMAPSLLRGDLVLILPLAPRRGDVVAVVDPLDPGRWTLRRVEAIGGNLRYDDIAFIADDQPEEVLEMGRDEAGITLREGPHLVRHLARTVRWAVPTQGVPDDAAFLGADNRDLALDSRWWGPVPLGAVQGVVALRVGAPGHPWRGWVEGRP